MSEDVEEVLNDKAVNAEFPNRDQIKALIARREEILDILEGREDKGWINDPYDDLRRELRAVVNTERITQKELNLASAELQLGFEIES